MEGRQIFNLIKHEQPQTISFVLSYLDGAKSAEVFGLLGPELREEVIERLGTIESTSLELVGKIARSLGKHFDSKVRPAFHRSGGVRAVADLLNQLEKDMSKNLLARLEERNAQLGAAIRKKLFSFDPKTEKFQSWPIPSGNVYAGIARHIRATKDGKILIEQTATRRIIEVTVTGRSASR